MSHLISLLQTYGLLFVFAAVAIEQMGLPLPAFPLLLVAGALSVSDGGPHWPALLLVSLVGCLLSDFFWYRAGQLRGRRVLHLLCKISVTPDYCVSQTEHYFQRFGPKSLIVAKFIPGFNTIAPPLAGAMGVGAWRFFGYSMVSGMLWSGVAIGLGMRFHTSLDQLLALFERYSNAGLIALAAVLGVFISYKYVQRHRRAAA
jgi:membrane protein DedA with SNARE-associated domain